eukprot:1458772-Pyramimonas_sp.AAC.1
MEVRVLQFLDLMLEAECTRADATILVAAVKDAYPWCTVAVDAAREQRAARLHQAQAPCLPGPRASGTSRSCRVRDAGEGGRGAVRS